MRIFYVFLLLLFTLSTTAQIIYGSSNYVEYHQGSLPVVISVPHGGDITPASIPDRTCNSPTLVTDANTIELAKQIDTSFFLITGCHPHIIYCNLKRTKLDCNRNLTDGACGNAEAATAWTEFHKFIDTAELLAQNQFGGKAFYIDLHGHGHSVQQLELGYLLTGNELNFSDSILNTVQYVGYSSVQNLVANNSNNLTHAQLLRGVFALGTLLTNAGYPSVPSQQVTSPGSNSYFAGGYNTANYTSYAAGKTVNGLQIECNYTNVRDSFVNRKKFGDSLAAVLVRFLGIHLNINTSNCAATMPVSMINFEANTTECHNNLRWQTGSEQNNRGFSIERSQNGVVYKSIAFTEGIGNSTKTTFYNYRDLNAGFGRNFYRLRQQNIDGTFTYSNTVSVNNNCNNERVIIYPNPVKHILYISSQSNISSNVVIYTVFGQKIVEWSLYGNQPKDVSKLGSGSYVAIINGTKKLYFVKE